MEFFVSFDMIKWFFSKTGSRGGAFRHVKSQRIYLWLLHFKSGRAKSIQEVMNYFGGTKQSNQKSIQWLIDMKLVTIQDGWICAVGKDAFSREIYKGRLFYSMYKFQESDLKDSDKFKAKIYKYTP